MKLFEEGFINVLKDVELHKLNSTHFHCAWGGTSLKMLSWNDIKYFKKKKQTYFVWKL